MLKGTVELKSLANAANWGLCDLASVYPSSSRPLPWATRAFFLFFERASRAGTIGLCTSCFLPGVLFSKNSAVWLLIVCHSRLSLAFADHNLQKPFGPFLPQCPVLFSWWFFSLNVVQALPVSNSYLSFFFAERILILFGITACPPKFSFFLGCLVFRYSLASEV